MAGASGQQGKDREKVYQCAAHIYDVRKLECKRTVKAERSQTPLAIHRQALAPGLYVVATPIGNLSDITLRALTVLNSADVVACEDTRQTGRLLHHFGIEAKLESYHDHNAHKKRPVLIALAEHKAVALVSDAGTPLISDPGYKLVREAAEAGVNVVAVPGASSVMAALSVAGLPTDRFLFEGFLPTSEKQAREVLQELASINATLIFFESAKRVKDTLALMRDVLGDREACVARELTKLYEEAVRGRVAELAERYANAPGPRGEIVIVVGPPQKVSEEAMNDERIKALLKKMSLKDAVAAYAAESGLPKGKVYARALQLKEEQ